MSGALSANNPLLLDPRMDMSAQHKVDAIKAITAPYAMRMLDETRYYVCTMPNHKMNRKDGGALNFIGGMLATSNYYDAEYIEQEIHNGNVYVRSATPEEVQAYKMTVDPVGTVRADMRVEIEARVRSELESELKDLMFDKLSTMKVGLTEEQKAELSDALDKKAQEVSGQDELGLGETNDSDKLAGTIGMAKLRAALAGKGTPSGTGTVFAPVDQPGPVLQGIGGTDKMAGQHSASPGDDRGQVILP